MSQSSGRMLRFDWTCASERHRKQEVVRRPKPGSPEPVRRYPEFRAYFLARTRLGKVVLIRVIINTRQGISEGDMEFIKEKLERLTGVIENGSIR